MRVVRTVAGLLLLTVGLPVLLVGGALWTLMQHRDAGGAFSARLEPVTAPGRAIVVTDVDALLREQAPFVRTGDTRLRLTSSEPVFLGLAPADAVSGFLAGAAHSRVDSVTVARGDLPVRLSPASRGAAQVGAPGAQSFWLHQGSGAVEWSVDEVKGKRLSLVIMRLDGDPGVAASLRASVRPGWLAPTTWSLLGAGLLLIAFAVAVLAWPVRTREVVFVVDPSQLPAMRARLGAVSPTLPVSPPPTWPALPTQAVAAPMPVIASAELGPRPTDGAWPDWPSESESAPPSRPATLADALAGAGVAVPQPPGPAWPAGSAAQPGTPVPSWPAAAAAQAGGPVPSWEGAPAQAGGPVPSWPAGAAAQAGGPVPSWPAAGDALSSAVSAPNAWRRAEAARLAGLPAVSAVAAQLSVEAAPTSGAPAGSATSLPRSMPTARSASGAVPTSGEIVDGQIVVDDEAVAGVGAGREGVAGVGAGREGVAGAAARAVGGHEVAVGGLGTAAPGASGGQEGVVEGDAVDGQATRVAAGGFRLRAVKTGPSEAGSDEAERDEIEQDEIESAETERTLRRLIDFVDTSAAPAVAPTDRPFVPTRSRAALAAALGEPVAGRGARTVPVARAAEDEDSPDEDGSMASADDAGSKPSAARRGARSAEAAGAAKATRPAKAARRSKATSGTAPADSATATDPTTTGAVATGATVTGSTVTGSTATGSTAAGSAAAGLTADGSTAAGSTAAGSTVGGSSVGVEDGAAAASAGGAVEVPVKAARRGRKTAAGLPAPEATDAGPQAIAVAALTAKRPATRRRAPKKAAPKVKPQAATGEAGRETAVGRSRTADAEVGTGRVGPPAQPRRAAQPKNQAS